jgi:UDP-2,4-diacetamido-2,4,6-trideoxy-beta-L-altropyranose hydrolase
VKVVIRADANHAIGVGHFTRCMTLARQLKSTGHEVEFQTRCDIPELAQQAADHGLPITQIDAAGAESAPAFTSTQSRYDWAVLDGYHFTEQAHQAAREIADNLLIIDDAPREIEYNTDLLLDQNHGAENQNYPLPRKAQLLGTTYALIRSEITALRENSLSHIQTNITSIVVTFGGSDPANATSKTIEALSMLDTTNLDINVIAGPANSNIPLLIQQCEESGFNLHINPPNLPKILSTSDLAIAATGTTVWELMCLAIPVLSLSIADNQIPAARALEHDGLINYFGRSSELSPESLSKLITENLAHPDKLATMARSASEQVDGRGAARVVEAMTQHLSNKNGESS